MPAPASPPSLRPPLRWAGGKRWQVPHLRPLWLPHAKMRLVEPFAGGLAVTLGLLPERALLNDANPHLINFYRWLQQGLTTDLQMENNERLFYRQRSRFNELIANGQEDTAEGAALFYYLNRTGFNGLCRFNQSGEFNVPFGRYARIGYIHDFTRYRGAFAGWTLTNDDSKLLRWSAAISSMRIRPTMWNSRSTQRADSPGKTRNARRHGSRNIVARSCW